MKVSLPVLAAVLLIILLTGVPMFMVEPSAEGNACVVGANQCGEGYLCRPLEFGSCGGDGNCVEIPAKCGYGFSFVCGCDGNSYSNMCRAEMVGVAVASNSPCDDLT